MSDAYQYISIGLYFLIPLAVLILLIWIIYRRIKGKSWFNAGTSFVAEHLYMQWETMSGRKAVTEMVYERDDKKEDAESGEDKEPGLNNDGETED